MRFYFSIRQPTDEESPRPGTFRYIWSGIFCGGRRPRLTPSRTHCHSRKNLMRNPFGFGCKPACRKESPKRLGVRRLS